MPVPPHVTVMVYVFAFTGTAPPVYCTVGVSPLEQPAVPACGEPSYGNVPPMAVTVGVIFAVAVKVMVGLAKVTPFGASPPATGVAVMVFVPPVAPSVQHTVTLPFASVVVAAADPNVPHAPPDSCGAVVPPP